MDSGAESRSALMYCCGEVYEELFRLNLRPGKEELVRYDESIKELVTCIKSVWVDKCGGDPARWPWNNGYVLTSYIDFRKMTRMNKDSLDRPRLMFTPENGTIYFLQNSRTHIKIGWTEGDPHKRLKQLQTGDSEELKLIGWIPGTQRAEKALHYRFALYRIRRDGEWFYQNDDLMNLIKDHRECLSKIS